MSAELVPGRFFEPQCNYVIKSNFLKTAMSFRLLIVSLHLLCVNVFVRQDDFLLIHYDKGPCRNKLGHSRASVIWHRTQVTNTSFSFLSPPSRTPSLSM